MKMWVKAQLLDKTDTKTAQLHPPRAAYLKIQMFHLTSLAKTIVDKTEVSSVN